MKKIFFIAVAILVSANVQASKPFAYTNGPNGTTLFYHEKCPAENAEKWQMGVIVFNNGFRMKGCWVKFKSKTTNQDTVAMCDLQQKEPGHIIVGQGCMYGSTREVYKGNPLPQAAFD